MILERAKRNMNKQKSVILSIALLSALSAGITADAREGLRLSTDPKLTEKAIEAQMKQSVSAKEVNFDNMLLQKNLNDMMPEGKVKAETSNIDIDLKGAVSTAIQIIVISGWQNCLWNRRKLQSARRQRLKTHHYLINGQETR